MKVKLETNDNLPISKIINVPMCVIILRGVSEVNIIHNCFYMIVFISMKKI